MKWNTVFPQKYNNAITSGDSRLSGKELRKREGAGTSGRSFGTVCVRSGPKRETGWSGWNSRSGIQDNSHVILGYSPCDEAVRYYTPRRRGVFSSRYRRPRADNLISDIAFIFNALAKSIHFEGTLYFDTTGTGTESRSSIAVWETCRTISDYLRLFSKLNFMANGIAPHIIFIMLSVALFSYPWIGENSTVSLFLSFSAWTLTVIFFPLHLWYIKLNRKK